VHATRVYSGDTLPAPTCESANDRWNAEEVKELDVEQLEERIAPTRI
jgi:hypothetical protein